MRLRVVLVEPEGEINLGFIARLIANFDVEEFFIVDPKIEIGDEARRFAARASNVLDKAIITKTLDEALRGVELSGCTSAIVGSQGDYLRHSISLEEFVDIAQRYSSVAIVFGRESVGLTRDELRKCNFVVYIPTSPKYPTLNVSHAVAISLYEFFRRKSRGCLEQLEYASPHDLEIIDKYVEQLASLTLSDRRHIDGASLSLKRALRRAKLTKTEAGLITILLRKSVVKLRECLKCTENEG